MTHIGSVFSNTALFIVEEIFKDNGIALTSEYRESDEVIVHTMGTPDENEIELYVDDAQAEEALKLYQQYMESTAASIESEAYQTSKPSEEILEEE